MELQVTPLQVIIVFVYSFAIMIMGMFFGSSILPLIRFIMIAAGGVCSGICIVVGYLMVNASNNNNDSNNDDNY